MSTAGTGVRATVHDRGARRVLYFFLATVTAVVLLLGYRTSTSSASVATGVVASAAGTSGTSGGTTTATPSPSSTAGAGTASGTAGAGTTSSGTTSSGTTSSAGGSGTYTGTSVETRWGPVQVQITVQDGTITAAQAVVVPSENPRDVQINAAAVPVLNSEAVKAQSAHIDTVSGATVTSDGYVTSLQSAIDAAGL